jgi:hypothetical protein
VTWDPRKRYPVVWEDGPLKVRRIARGSLYEIQFDGGAAIRVERGQLNKLVLAVNKDNTRGTDVGVQQQNGNPEASSE